MSERCPVCNTPASNGALACRSCGSPIGAPASAATLHALPPGTALQGGAFTVGKVLGQGGFGITYLGSDRRLRRPVAIKEFFPQGCIRRERLVQPTGAMGPSDYQTARGRFLEEARLLARFRHPGIVQVLSSFEENHTAYMVMELLKGDTLLHLLDTHGPFPEPDALDAISRVGQALEVVHQAQLLHRDLKPENVIRTSEGRVVLLDFGTAREFAAGKTRRMTAMLTPGYAPLEQYGQQARFGAFTDVYALGAMLYHLLTGQVPAQATDRAAGVSLQAPHRVRGSISRGVSEAVMWAMEMKVDRRPQSVREFLEALRGRAAVPRPAAAPAGPSASTSLKFRSGEASSVLDLIDLCDRYPDEAQDYLFNGYLERWLAGHLGEAAMGQQARAAARSQEGEKRQGLELLVRELCRSASVEPYPRLVAHPGCVDLGEAPVGGRVSGQARLRNVERGFAWGRVTVPPELPGLTGPARFESQNALIELHLDTAAVPPGDYRGEILVQAEGVPTSCRLPVQYRVVPLVLQAEPPSLVSGPLRHGAVFTATLKVTSQPEGAQLSGAAFAEPPMEGLQVTPVFHGSGCELQVTADTARLEAGRRYETRVGLDTGSGRVEVPVCLQTRLRWEIVAGWAAGAGFGAGLGMGVCRSALAGMGTGLRGWFLSYTTASHSDWWVAGLTGALALAAMVWGKPLRSTVMGDNLRRLRPGSLARLRPPRVNLREAIRALRRTLARGVTVPPRLRPTLRCSGRIPKLAASIAIQLPWVRWLYWTAGGLAACAAIALAALGLAFLGMTLIIPVEFAARSFTWVGIHRPEDGWSLLGCLCGGVAGAARGLERARFRSAVPRLWGGAAVLGSLLLVAAYLVGNGR